MAKMKDCILCEKKEVKTLLDLKLQTLCNRFLDDPLKEEYVHNMIIGQCHSCGMIQLEDLAPIKELQPQYNWITYKESEEHLDKLAEEISKLTKINKNSKIMGMSFKDDSLLDRMNKLGFPNTYRIDTKNDLGITKTGTGIETIQDKLDKSIAHSIINKHSKSDLLILRHILEHAYDVSKFTDALRELVSEDGYVLIEIPECSSSLDALDYTTIWEDHTMYFTPNTFKHYCELHKLSLNYFEIFPYKLENSLAIIGQFKKDKEYSSFDEKILSNEINRGNKFGNEFYQEKNRIKQVISDFNEKGGKIALFGAGHLGCTFINLFELGKYINCAIDDNPNKQGLYLSGSKIPIYGSDYLIKNKINLCLLSMNIESENKIIEKNKDFSNQGGIFASIFKLSKIYLENIIK